MKKICPKCHLEKDESEYSPSQLKKSGLCRSCIKERNTTYYEKNREDILIRMKEYGKVCADEISAYQETYRNTHREEKNLAERRRYRAKKTELNRQSTEYQKKRRKNEPAYKLRKYLSTYIGIALKRQGSSKAGDSIMQFLPYDLQELKEHIEKQFQEPGNEWMTWENHGKYVPKTWDDDDPTTWKWQLDHIKPHSTFHYTSMEDQEFKDCWALENLRPYSAKRNIIDGRRKQ